MIKIYQTASFSRVDIAVDVTFPANQRSVTSRPVVSRIQILVTCPTSSYMVEIWKETSGHACNVISNATQDSEKCRR